MTPELFERYLAEVGRRLGRREAEDVTRELRSSLDDALDAKRSEAGPDASDDALAREVLLAMGPPDRLAAAYGPGRSLVGPTLYPAFVRTARIVLGVLAALLVGLALADLFEAGGRSLVDAASRFGTRMAGTWDALLTVFGLLVLIFAMLERARDRRGPSPREERAWDPADLPPARDRTGVRVGAVATDAAFSFLFAGLLLAFGDRLALLVFHNDVPTRVPIAGAALTAAVPWLIAWCLADGILAVRVLVAGRWTALDHAVRGAIAVAAGALLVWMAAQPDLLAIGANWDTSGLDAEFVTDFRETMFPWLAGLARFAAAAGSVGLSVRAVRSFVWAWTVRGEKG